MDVVAGWQDVPADAKGAVLAIGNFDGVHRGHQAVLGRAIDLAKKEGARSGAVVFEPHPREFFAPDQPFFRLTPLPVKLELLEALGLDETFVIDFKQELASLSADAFATDIIANGLGARQVVVGHDFTYGKGRTGSPEELARVGQEHGYAVEVVKPVALAGVIFSSSQVREHLRKGEMEEAAEQLGYWWRVRGRVEPGAGRGRGLGFPTINLELLPGQDVGHGIYAMRAILGGKRYPAAGYVGASPTFAGGRPMLEAYLLDFEGDLYGKEVEIEFIRKLRDDAAFANPEALATQMAKDCAHAAKLLGKIDAHDPMARFPLGRALGATGVATGL